MTFNEYQTQAKTTAIYPEIGARFVYPALGLCGESGEVADKIKKIFRDQGGVVSEETRQLIGKELGDVLWYVAQLSSEFGFTFDEIAQINLDKLASRSNRAQLNGNGDLR